jgi:GTP diphosphokinase / guanosine-3',5'-bis(diphosphate) 3'-diphosphatase
LQAFSTQLSDISHQRIQEILEELELESLDRLLDDIGLGNRSVFLIAQKLLHDGISEDHEQQPLLIAGTEGMVVNFARCCHPIPGDPITGFVSAGRGIIIHQQDCNSILSLREQQEKWLDVAWSPDVNREFPVDIIVHARNQRGVLATIAVAVSEADSNIDNVMVDERDSEYSDLRLTIEVINRQHLARVIRRLRRIDVVERITRINH